MLFYWGLLLVLITCVCQLSALHTWCRSESGSVWMAAPLEKTCSPNTFGRFTADWMKLRCVCVLKLFAAGSFLFHNGWSINVMQGSETNKKNYPPTHTHVTTLIRSSHFICCGLINTMPTPNFFVGPARCLHQCQNCPIFLSLWSHLVPNKLNTQTGKKFWLNYLILLPFEL